MISRTSVALVMAGLLSATSFAQVTGGVVRPTPTEAEPPHEPGQLITGGAGRRAPVEGQAAPQSAPQPAQVQVVPQQQALQPPPQAQQPLNAPAERKGRQNDKDKSPLGGLF
jgi:hypothetical protein